MSGLQLFGIITVFATVGIVFVCFILYLRIMSKRHFKCPYCGQRFKVSTMKTFFSFNSSADKVLTCPSCGKSGKMDFQHDDNFDSTMPEQQTGMPNDEQDYEQSEPDEQNKTEDK